MKYFCRKIILTVSLFTLLSGSAFAQKLETAGVERYAIYIGSNIGGKNNERLLYAGTDAISFQKTMSEIGGIPKSNSVLLLDPTKDDVDNAMNAVSAMIDRNKENAKRSEFIFYYSGHSDENALILGKNLYSYSALKTAISSVPSDVHVVILDSCYSGNFIRTKGGQKQKPFLVDDSSVIKGHAYLSSSSSQEFSQESDEIGSSFFTNAMITGLKGAADSSGDKKVTLNELYSYAFDETLSKTENTSTGPQHPNYNITLVGSGDLILSDISNSDCILTLSKELNGRIIIRDKNEKLIAEINKTANNPVYLAMEEGQYGVTVISASATLQGNFSLASKRNYILTAGNLSPVVRTATRLRGEDIENVNAADDEESIYYPATFSFLFNEFYRGSGKNIVTSFAFGLLRADVYQVNGAMISGITNQADIVNGAQAAGIFNMANHVNGAQGAGIFNIAYDVKGLQGSGIFNFAHDVIGAQGSGMINFAKNVTGVQGSGLINIAHDVKYVQGTGVINVAVHNLTGVQGAGVTNYAGSLNGLQGSGVGNVSGGDVKGFQGSGVFNVSAGNVTGVQATSCINFATGVKGVQAGLVNICTGDVEGLQIGLINISKNGVLEIGTSYTTENDLRFTFNSGSKYLYTILGYSAALKSFNSELNLNERYGHAILGLGSRLEIGPVNMDFEFIGNEIIISDDKTDADINIHSVWYPSFRYAVGYSPVKHLNIFTGFQVGVEYSGNTEAFERKTKNWVIETPETEVKFLPEFDFGVKFQFN